MQNIQEQIHLSQHTLSVFLKTLRVCQLSVKRNENEHILENFKCLIDQGYNLAVVNPSWFSLYGQSFLVALPPFARALLNAVHLGIIISKSLGLNLQTYKKLALGCCLTIYSNRALVDELSNNPKLTPSLKVKLKAVLEHAYSTTQTTPLFDQYTQSILASTLGHNETKNQGLLFQSALVLIINYCFIAARNSSVKRRSCISLLTDIIVNPKFIPLKKKLTALYPTVISEALRYVKSGKFLNQKGKTLFCFEDTAANLQYLSYVENQKKPSNFVVQLEDNFDLTPDFEGFPSFKLEQLNGLSIRMHRVMLSHNLAWFDDLRLPDKIRFNAPPFYQSLCNAVTHSPISKIEDTIKKNDMANDIVQLAINKSRVATDNMSLRHAITLLGVERMPTIVMAQLFVRIASHQKGIYSNLIVDKLANYQSIVSEVVTALRIDQQSDAEMIAGVLVMAGLTSEDGQIEQNPYLPEVQHKVDDQLLAFLFGGKSIEILRSRAAQIALNWSLSRSQQVQLNVYLDFLCGNTPLRLIPLKHQTLIHCFGIANYCYQSIHFPRFDKILEKTLESNKASLNLSAEQLEQLIQKCIETTHPKTKLL